MPHNHAAAAHRALAERLAEEIRLEVRAARAATGGPAWPGTQRIAVAILDGIAAAHDPAIIEALTRGAEQHDTRAAVEAMREECASAVPTTWLDPLLSGPDCVLLGSGGTWGCPDVERLLSAVAARIRAPREALEGREEGDAPSLTPEPTSIPRAPSDAARSLEDQGPGDDIRGLALRLARALEDSERLWSPVVKGAMGRMWAESVRALLATPEVRALLDGAAS